MQLLLMYELYVQIDNCRNFTFECHIPFQGDLPHLRPPDVKPCPKPASLLLPERRGLVQDAGRCAYGEEEVVSLDE